MSPRRALPVALLLASLLVLAGGGAGAHFLLNINIRILHVEHLDEGLRVYLRLPMPYLIADKLGEPLPDGTVPPAPFTTNERAEDGQLLHFLDEAALAADPLGLGRIAAEGHRIVPDDGVALAAEVLDVRLNTALTQPPFATLDEARDSFRGDRPEIEGRPYVGDLVVDVLLRYPAPDAVPAYALSSTLNPGLPGQEETANLVVDHWPGADPLIFRERGLLATPIEIERSPLAAALTFVKEGVRHILEGLDHVLFVLCLTIGAGSVANLLWRVTGFTLGHTVTLILGFLGHAPTAPWFIPAVETGIALSIVYAGVVAVLERPSATTFLIAAAIGLLHGLGFSFVLHEILRIDAPNLWESLLAFNLGVEIGQVLVVLAVYPALRLIRWLRPGWETAARWTVALPCIAIAAMWTVERLGLLSETL